jgi:hypothetical protein
VLVEIPGKNPLLESLLSVDHEATAVLKPAQYIRVVRVVKDLHELTVKARANKKLAMIHADVACSPGIA